MIGLTRKFPQFSFRTVPSAGGLYPIEIYPIINNVKDLNQGIYHYNIPNHSLELLKKGDSRIDIMKGCLDQIMVFNSAVSFVWTAVIERSKWKYLQRCYRYIYLDAGHIGQNLYRIIYLQNQRSKKGGRKMELMICVGSSCHLKGSDFISPCHSHLVMYFLRAVD